MLNRKYQTENANLDKDKSIMFTNLLKKTVDWIK